MLINEKKSFRNDIHYDSDNSACKSMFVSKRSKDWMSQADNYLQKEKMQGCMLIQENRMQNKHSFKREIKSINFSRRFFVRFICPL